MNEEAMEKVQEEIKVGGGGGADYNRCTLFR